MPDKKLSKALLETAELLVNSHTAKPTQANLRRAVSTAYYAVFHALAQTVADSLVGSNKSKRPNKAWTEVYRGLQHGNCKDACRIASKINFPDAIQDFAATFWRIQEARHTCDYDPIVRVKLKDAEFFVESARLSIQAIQSASTKDKKAFSAWVMITSPGAKEARKRSKLQDPSSLRQN